LPHLMNAPACDEAMRLLGTYRAGLGAYDRVHCPAFQNLAPEHITLEEAAQAREDAHAALTRARRAYWKHVDEHSCRRLILVRPTSGISGTITMHL